MGRLSLGQRAAIVPARYFSNFNFGTPDNVAFPDTLRYPNPTSLDFSGYNTMSAFFTLAAVVGTIDVFINTIDPEDETGGVIPGNLGRAPIASNLAASGNYATTLFLPTYYSTLTGLIMPFFSNIIEFTPDAASSCTVSVLKVWLTNTGTAS